MLSVEVLRICGRNCHQLESYYDTWKVAEGKIECEQSQAGFGCKYVNGQCEREELILYKTYRFLRGRALHST